MWRAGGAHDSPYQHCPQLVVALGLILVLPALQDEVCHLCLQCVSGQQAAASSLEFALRVPVCLKQILLQALSAETPYWLLV